MSSVGAIAVVENLKSQLNIEYSRSNNLLKEIAKLEDDKRRYQDQRKNMSEVFKSVSVLSGQLDALLNALLGFSTHMCFGSSSDDRSIRQQIAMDYMFPLIRMDSRIESLYTQIYYDKGPPYPTDPDYPNRMNEPLVKSTATILRVANGHNGDPPLSSPARAPANQNIDKLSPQRLVNLTAQRAVDAGIGDTLQSLGGSTSYITSKTNGPVSLETGGRIPSSVLTLSKIPLEGLKLGISSIILTEKSTPTANSDSKRLPDSEIAVCVRYDTEDAFTSRTLVTRRTQSRTLQLKDTIQAQLPDNTSVPLRRATATFNEAIKIQPLPPKTKSAQLPSLIVEVIHVPSESVIACTKVSFGDMRTLKPTFSLKLHRGSHVPDSGAPPSAMGLPRGRNPSFLEASEECIVLILAPMPNNASLPACVVAHRRGLVDKLLKSANASAALQQSQQHRQNASNSPQRTVAGNQMTNASLPAKRVITSAPGETASPPKQGLTSNNLATGQIFDQGRPSTGSPIPVPQNKKRSVAFTVNDKNSPPNDGK